MRLDGLALGRFSVVILKLGPNPCSMSALPYTEPLFDSLPDRVTHGPEPSPSNLQCGQRFEPLLVVSSLELDLIIGTYWTYQTALEQSRHVRSISAATISIEGSDKSGLCRRSQNIVHFGGACSRSIRWSSRCMSSSLRGSCTGAASAI